MSDDPQYATFDEWLAATYPVESDDQEVALGFDGASGDAGHLAVTRRVGDHITIIDDPHARLLTREEAAAVAHVPVKTVDTWVRRGRLAVAATGPLYREIDVLVTERATRQAPRLRRLLALASKVKHSTQQDTSAQSAEPAPLPCLDLDECPNRVDMTALDQVETTYACGCWPPTSRA